MLAGLIMDYGGVLTDLGPTPCGVPPLVTAVRLARAHGLVTALLSNADGPGAGPPGLTGLTGLFDAVVLSGQVGVGKPDPRAYRLVARRLGLPPAGCVFVDDSAVNVRGAAAVGMVGVHHVDVDATLDELAVLFGFTFR